MPDFAEVMATDPHRLVVLFKYGHDGSETFEWGVYGTIPILSLIGRIIEVQSDLVCGEYIPETQGDQAALVLTFEKDTYTMRHFLHPSVPREPLCGMLEVIKTLLVGSRMAQHAAAHRSIILGPDGQPMRH